MMLGRRASYERLNKKIAYSLKELFEETRFLHVYVSKLMNQNSLEAGRCEKNICLLMIFKTDVHLFIYHFTRKTCGGREVVEKG